MGKYQEASDRTRVGVFSDDYIFVDDSIFLESLGVTGKGLYAATNYEPGDVIIEYKGKILSDNEAERKKRAKQYLMDVKQNGKVVHVIDGANAKLSSAGRFANTTLTWNDRRRNAEIKQYNKKMYLVASKKIHKGKEILIFYGPDTVKFIN